MTAKRARKHEEEEHENHERWLISYADMITLLMVLFVVMFAISNVDRVKFAALSEGLATGFGAPRFVAVNGSDNIIEGGGPVMNAVKVDEVKVGPPSGAESDGEHVLTEAQVAMAEAADAQISQATAEALLSPEAARDLRAAVEELDRLEGLRAQAQAALAADGLQDRATFTITEEGLVVILVADDVFFANGSAVIQPVGERVIDALLPVLREAENAISAEGHANHLPPAAGSIYPSNWELSSARAASVVRRLVDVGGLPGTRLDATGFGDTRPLVPEGDPTALERNRRVDLLIRSGAIPEVRALLPGLADTRS